MSQSDEETKRMDASERSASLPNPAGWRLWRMRAVFATSFALMSLALYMIFVFAPAEQDEADALVVEQFIAAGGLVPAAVLAGDDVVDAASASIRSFAGVPALGADDRLVGVGDRLFPQLAAHGATSQSQETLHTVAHFDAWKPPVRAGNPRASSL